MMIKFFSHGLGGGAGPVNYLCCTHGHQGRERQPVPEILGGNPSIIREIIDTVPHKYKYTSGVLSFAPEDAPTPAQQAEVMRLFEQAAFPGMKSNQYCILWVRHAHKKRIELHFIIPRIELSSGRAYNPAPPGWQCRYDPLRDMLNYRYGWARPDDPMRVRLFQPGIRRLIAASGILSPANSLKEKIVQAVIAEIRQGNIHNRLDIISFLKSKGFSLPRIGANYITIMDAEGKRHRLKGNLFEDNFRTDQYSLIKNTYIQRIDDKKSQQAEILFEKEIKKVSAYNFKRYANRRQDNDGSNLGTQDTFRDAGEKANRRLYDDSQSFYSIEHSNERGGFASEYIIGSGGESTRPKGGTGGSRAIGRQEGESQNPGRCNKRPASGHAGTQGNSDRRIKGIFQRTLRMILAVVEDLRDKSLSLRRFALQTKLQSLPKVQPRRASFASIVGTITQQLDSLQAEVITLKRALFDRRLKKLQLNTSPPRMQVRDLSQLLGKYFYSQVRPLQVEAARMRFAALNLYHRGRKSEEHAAMPGVTRSVVVEQCRRTVPAEADTMQDTHEAQTPSQ